MLTLIVWSEHNISYGIFFASSAPLIRTKAAFKVGCGVYSCPLIIFYTAGFMFPWPFIVSNVFRPKCSDVKFDSPHLPTHYSENVRLHFRTWAQIWFLPIWSHCVENACWISDILYLKVIEDGGGSHCNCFTLHNSWVKISAWRLNILMFFLIYRLIIWFAI